MNKKLFLILFIFNCSIYAQVTFEKGYFIDTKNIKTECLIRNHDWSKLSDKIEYKLTEASIEEEISLLNLTEFQIYNTDHYYRKYTFNIDKDVENKNIKTESVTDFLKVLIEGKASLLEFNREFYFYNKEGNDTIKQLLFKKYVDKNRMIHEDYLFRKELFDNLNCEKNTINIRKIKYLKREFINFFKSYNTCENSEFKIFEANKSKAKFDFNILLGTVLNKSKGSLFSGYSGGSIPSSGGSVPITANNDYFTRKNQTNIMVGFEAEVVLPYFKNAWSLFTAPNYQYLKGEKIDNITYFSYPGNLTIKDISYIEIPLGVKRYFFINNHSKIHLSFAYNFISQISDEKIAYFTRNGQPENTTNAINNYEKKQSSIRITTGYTYKDQYNVSLVYYPVKKISNNFESDLSGSIGIYLAYKLF
ncbi:hypothetical protein FIA58_016785 [Flavobacterium jejuense]|uniref:Outer membrane protein beta-barrel domain-containing protein n=1 Tax=Flavobacterium jejuense TaxID=1544455 RepID=A0ABX0J012_9FLAO|nr:hypothetical protein [Flavobacterium jejuense]NHN27339.1 hypothetical protein [Flavobacterium jejuense]